MHCTLREVPNYNLTLVDHGCNNYFRGWLTYVAEFCDYSMVSPPSYQTNANMADEKFPLYRREAPLTQLWKMYSFRKRFSLNDQESCFYC